MLVAFVSGPYSADSPYGIEQNVRKAEAVSYLLWKNGIATICPHANTRFKSSEICEANHIIPGYLEILRRCDLCVVIAGWEKSLGTLKEIEEARWLGIPIFYINNENDDIGHILAYRYPNTRTK